MSMNQRQCIKCKAHEPAHPHSAVCPAGGYHEWIAVAAEESDQEYLRAERKKDERRKA
jgi:hypothetical protein